MSEQLFTAERAEGARQFMQLVQLSMQRQRLAPNVNASDPFQRRHSGPGRRTYQGARDYGTVLGRSDDLDFQDYHDLYQRGGLAGNVIDVRANDTWGEPPTVTEDDNAETEFVKAWDDLAREFSVWDVLRRADALSGIGEYGALLFGLAGKDDLSEPVEKGSLDGLNGLLYLRPFHQGGAEIAKSDDDRQSKRCGFPLLYDVQLAEDERVEVHWTRMLHLVEFRMDSEILGRPWLMRPYDTLMDMIYKILGGSAEAAWLNMRKGAVIGPKEGYDWDLDDATERADFTDQLEAYAHDLARFLLSGGVEVQEIGGADVWDPRSAFDIHVDVISAESRIPKHILLGSAAGELASSESDDRRWAGTIRRRQNNYAGPRVLSPFAKRLVWYGILPEPKAEIAIGELDDRGKRNWPSIIQMTDEQSANVVLRRASAVKQLADPATGTVDLSPKERRVLLGQPADVPEDMRGDVEGMPEPPEPEAVTEPGMDGVPEMPREEPEIIEPPGEPDEETERARMNEMVAQQMQDILRPLGAYLDPVSDPEEAMRLNALFTASHTPVIVPSACPLPDCGGLEAESYEGHGPLLRCAKCKKTYDPTVEGVGPVRMHEEGDDAHA
jgi:hypothetical protein